MYFTSLNTNEFESFVKKNFAHYTQSKEHFQYRNQHKKDAHLVGVKNENNDVLAACLLTEARCFKFFKYFYTHRGPVMDYKDLNLVRFFFEQLNTYLKKQKCIYVLVDPYTLQNIRDSKGNIITAYDNKLLVNTLKPLGYSHQGFSVGYSSMSQIRWLSILNLKDKSEDKLLEEMDYQTRRNIKKHMKWMYKLKHYQLKKLTDFLSYLKWQKKNTDLSLETKHTLKKCKKFIKTIACLNLPTSI